MVVVGAGGGSAVGISIVEFCGYGLTGWFDRFVNVFEDLQHSAGSDHLGIGIEAKQRIRQQSWLAVYRHLRAKLKQCVVAGGFKGLGGHNLAKAGRVARYEKAILWSSHL